MTCTFDLDCYLVSFFFFCSWVCHILEFLPVLTVRRQTGLLLPAPVISQPIPQTGIHLWLRLRLEHAEICELKVSDLWLLWLRQSVETWWRTILWWNRHTLVATLTRLAPSTPPPPHPVPQMKTCHGSPRISDLSRTFYCCKDILNSRPGGASYVIIWLIHSLCF